MFPGSDNEGQRGPFNELEQAYRNIADQQTNWTAMQPRPLPDVEHRLNFLKLKTRYRAHRSIRQLHRNKKRIGFFLLPVILILILFFVYSVLLPKTIEYKFADVNNCVTSPLLLPGLFKTSDNAGFGLTRARHRLLGVDIASSKLCANPITSPKASTSYAEKESLNILGLKLHKVITIKTSSYPLANVGNLGVKAIPIEQPLKFKLSSNDATFSYDIRAANQTATCQKDGGSVSCSLAQLKLAYGTSYTISLVRTFNKKVVSTVLSRNVQTITATAITQTSIGDGSTVYDKPQQLTISLSKSLTKVAAISLTYKNAAGVSTAVPITSSFKTSQITVNWTAQLPRQTTFDLHLENVTAIDSSTLEQPYDLIFATSGGPSVIDSNIPSYGLSTGQSMGLTFSQPLDTSQNPASLVSLEVNGQTAAAAVTFQGNQRIVITPSAGYPVCATVKVVVSSSVESNYDVSGNSAWSFVSRSHCYITYSIGTSVQGRQITAYQFGSGPSMVLYIAAMEGNEQNSANLLTQWIPDVDANPGKIPSYRTLVIIPQINPDGYAADTRLNAAGIDLNRNFPANNWSETVTEPLANTVETDDGGPYPLSAPESQALASFYETHKPRLTLTEHSHGGIVEANDAGDSIQLGAEYANLAGYRPIPTYAIGNFFAYTTTGAFEDWANDKLGLPVLEIELESATNDEYSRNLPALWAMAQVSQ